MTGREGPTVAWVALATRALSWAAQGPPLDAATPGGSGETLDVSTAEPAPQSQSLFLVAFQSVPNSTLPRGALNPEQLLDEEWPRLSVETLIVLKGFSHTRRSNCR